MRVRRAAGLMLPSVPLALIQESVLRRGDELLRRAEIVRVVRLAPARQRHHRGVMKVVVPERVEAATTALDGMKERRVLRLVLTDNPRAPLSGALANRLGDLGEDMRPARILDGLGGVQPQPIEVKFLDPVAGVGQHVVAHAGRARPVEVDAPAPVRHARW